MTGGACGAVVLAAGEARRFGSPKLLMPFGCSSVIGSVVQSLARAGVSPIVVVAGAEPEAIAQALSGKLARIVCNASWQVGMISSIRTGVETLPNTLDRFVVALGDQPRIRGVDVSRLIEEMSESGKGIAIPTYRGRRGHPVVFDIGYRERILALTDRQSLRDLVTDCPDDIVEVCRESDACVKDIDTREDYENELARWRAER